MTRRIHTPSGLNRIGRWYFSLFEDNPDALVIISREGVVLEANRAARALLPVDSDLVVGSAASDLFGAQVAAQLRDLALEGHPEQVFTRTVHLTGTQLRAWSVPLDDGPVVMVCLLPDEAVQRATPGCSPLQLLWDHLMKATGGNLLDRILTAIVQTAEAQGAVLYVKSSDGWRLAGKVQVPAEAGAAFASIADQTFAKVSTTGPVLLGSVCDIELSGSPVWGLLPTIPPAAGEVSGVIGLLFPSGAFFADGALRMLWNLGISTLVSGVAELLATASAPRADALLPAACLAGWTCSWPDLYIWNMTPAMQALLGVAFETGDHLAFRVTDFVEPEDILRHKAALTSLVAHGKAGWITYRLATATGISSVVEWVQPTPNAQSHSLELVGLVFRQGEDSPVGRSTVPSGVAVTASDSQPKDFSALDAVPWPVFVVDDIQRIVVANQGLRTLATGSVQSNIRFDRFVPGSSIGDVFGGCGAALVQDLHSRLTEVLSGQRPTSEVWIEDLMEAEERTERLWLLVAAPLAGQERLIACGLWDVTVLRATERHQFQTLRRESLGMLAAGLALDFNDLLTSLLGYSSLMQTQVSDQDPIRPMLAEMERAAARAAELVRMLLAYGRGGRTTSVAVNLNRIVERMTQETLQTHTNHIRLRLDLAADVRSAQGDPSQIELVIRNLVANACQAMPDGGELVVSTANIDTGPLDAQTAGLAGGRWVRLSISDSGTGVPPELRDQLFDPYFTTRPGKRGLGLTVADGIIRSHGGAIRMATGPGRGTTVHVYLPAADPRAELDDPITGPGPAQGNGTVLVVDDDETCITVCRRMLEPLGYQVLGATTYQEGIQLASGKGAVDVVLLDVMMPDSHVWAGYRLLRQVCPNAAIVVVSGFAVDREVRHLLAIGADGFLAKPYTLHSLCTAITAAQRRRNQSASPPLSTD